MTPKHVAIILDGNRRFAKKLSLDSWKGHDHGKQKVEELLNWCKELGVKELTLYALSIQNLSRPKVEVDYLLNIIKNVFETFYTDKRIDEDKVRVNVIGRYDLLPKEIVVLIEKIVEKTKNYDNYIINLALAYGGREEITDAVKKIAKSVMFGKFNPEDIVESTIQENLYLQSEPDLIIRTGGDKRTSNFLIWQSYYSEWFFVDKMWPEFTKEDLVQIFNEFEQRERRFGK
jgi:tritrans,polycis-undecaprenyl-diphosphate synthase [geranylgeranyl-diphosphate specific]